MQYQASKEHRIDQIAKSLCTTNASLKSCSVLIVLLKLLFFKEY